jgi:hypothetical protein
MKYAIVALALALTGCASVTEYNQGCRDGIASIMRSPNRDGIATHCDNLENIKEGVNLDRPRGRQNH